jgi:hypothetical protein
MDNRLRAIREIQKVIDEMIGLDIEKVDDLTLVDYESRGYPKAARIKDVKRAELRDIKSTAPPLDLYKEIINILEKEKEPRSKLKEILEKLAPYGSWATLAYNILQKCGLL